jgi:acetyl-CoA C-acetyltransferase
VSTRPASACIVGAFEHPTRKAPDKTVAQLHAECAAGALADAGLARDDIDAYFCSGDAPGMGPLSMVDYLNLKVRHTEATDLGGCSYLALVAHARDAIAAGRCHVALITLAGRPRSEGSSGTAPRTRAGTPEAPWETPYGLTTVNGYGMVAQRHMHEYGTTVEQLAWIKVAASHHAQHNPHAMLRDVVTVEDVVASPVVSDPLRRLDCCVVSPTAAAPSSWRGPRSRAACKRPVVRVIGAGETVRTRLQGRRRVRPHLFRRRWSAARSPSPKPASRRPTSSTPASTTASPSPC